MSDQCFLCGHYVLQQHESFFYGGHSYHGSCCVKSMRKHKPLLEACRQAHTVCYDHMDGAPDATYLERDLNRLYDVLTAAIEGAT